MATAAQRKAQIAPFIVPVIAGAIGLFAVKKIFDLFGDDDKDIPPPPESFDLPTAGSGIPKGWTPTAGARTLHNAMQGLGTDSVTIFAVLQNATKDQLVAIYNEFTRLFWAEGDGDLFNWFSDDLDAEDLGRALAFFNETGL